MGRTVVITGASGGIGGAVAEAFAARGERTVLVYHSRPQPAEALCERLSAAGHAAVALRADVGSEADVDALFAAAEARFGPAEVLVNAAGFAQQKLFDTLTLAEWETMLRVHATGAFLCCRRALPHMLRRKSGCIVNIASMWGQVGASCEVHYSAAKAAVIGLTKALAKEVAPSGVRVNCVAPGAVDTAMMSGFTPAERENLCEGVPMGRLGSPAEVAGAVLWLASPGAGYVTGQVVGVNGGLVV